MEKTHYHLDLIFANLFFGANFSFYVSLTRNYLDFQQIFLLQVLSAALFFIPFALFSRYSYRITWRDAGKILLVTLLIVYGWMYMLLWGSSYTTPIDASVIATLGPAFTLIMDHLLHPHKYLPGRLVGVLAALIGAGILLFNEGFELTHGSRAEGNLFVLLAVVAIAINTVLIKPQLERLGTLVVMGWYYIIGLAVTAPFFWKYIAHTDFLLLPLQAQAELAYILILGTVLPMYLLYRGTEKLTSVHTALYRYIQPVAAGLLAVTRGQAHFNAENLTAAGFIFTGVILVVAGYRSTLHRGLPRLRKAGSWPVPPHSSNPSNPSNPSTSSSSSPSPSAPSFPSSPSSSSASSASSIPSSSPSSSSPTSSFPSSSSASSTPSSSSPSPSSSLTSSGQSAESLSRHSSGTGQPH